VTLAALHAFQTGAGVPGLSGTETVPMSIPTRLYRIAKYKLGEIKERLDQLDEEQARAEEQRLRQAQARTDARRELDDAMASPLPASAPPASVGPDLSPTRSEPSAIPAQPPLSRRTPEEIARGSRPLPQNAPPPANAPQTGMPQQADPLTYHYKLLGVEPGADFVAVQAAYNKLAARSDPSRFPAGSPEEQEAQGIHKRLDASFETLRDALDPTARRFDLIEY
jgi:hypothetical protein